ncbi:hypothetical protein H4R18_002418 [Coemansia javaensis]|uniref:Uncharacterized protein n=1 Tax=Coemansia javaensis TaxID=2761396 RepID=A0A9W8HF60_9FUNG|nr:hypothetical protein H4R18_002418 [Coemansia javaensis]
MLIHDLPNDIPRLILEDIFEDIGASGGKGRLGAGFMPAAIRSNLGLAVSIGCLHVVKEVHLCVWGEASASITLNEAVRFMRATASKLDGVKSLKICNIYGWLTSLYAGQLEEFNSSGVFPFPCGKLTLVHVEEIVDNTSTAWRLHLPGLQQLRVDTPNSTRSLLEHTLMIGSRDMVVRPDDITSTTLTQLVIHSAASVDTMLGLVQKLPNLIHLFLSCFVPDVIEADLTVPGPDDEAVLEPFNAKLNDLTLSHQGVWPLGKLTTVVWHLVLRVPTLRHLTVGNGEKLPMEEFVSVYSERYPHLASVKLDLPPFSV